MVSYNEYFTSLTTSTDNTDNDTDEQTHRCPDTIALLNTATWVLLHFLRADSWVIGQVLAVILQQERSLHVYKQKLDSCLLI
jgi:hypothetical protein